MASAAPRSCVTLGPMGLGLHPARRLRSAAVAACVAALVAAMVSSCSSGPTPQATATDYLTAWSEQNWVVMRQLVDNPPADFTAVNQAAFADISVHDASFTGGTLSQSGSTASEPFTETLALTGVGTVSIHPTLHLVQLQGKWLVQWTPATIAPQLLPGDQLSLRTTWPARAPILGAGGVPLTTQGQVVTIGVEGLRIKDTAAVQAALVSAGATAAQASDAIAAAKRHPTYFEPVFTVPRDRYNQIESTIYPIPGTVFQSGTALSAVTPGLTAGLVGTVGPITAQELSQLGAPYTAQSVVGQTGLEGAQERQLAGTPGATVSVVRPGGASVATVATVPPHPGTPVTTTINPTVQQAAEAALSGEQKIAALVAVDASTGGVLAAVSVNTGPFDLALDGAQPPGSTFKVITSTALITHGLTPQSAASCPLTATVDGEVFHNAEGEAQLSTLLQAFTESCNTAFIQLATHNLSVPDLPAAAAMYGLTRVLRIGLVAFGGSVPQPKDQADLAATSIGQGRVLMSPLGLAMVAAAVDTGTVRAPQLVNGTPDGTVATSQLPAALVSALHQMMASVVASGTAAGQGLPAGTYAKTGTAQYGTTAPLKTDAWLMGFNGKIAFAALVVDSDGNGGPTCGPIVAKFLNALAGSGAAG